MQAWIQLSRECVAFAFILGGVLFGLAVNSVRRRERDVERRERELRQDEMRFERMWKKDL